MGTTPNEELCLRWNDFESILSRSFGEMREESDFFDVRVACFDEKAVMKTIPAHRVVLSACSPVFKEILRSLGPGDAKGPLIFLRGISYHEMEAVLDFMYNGQTKVQHKELDAFLAAAEELKIKGLTSSQNTSETPTRKRQADENGVKKGGSVKKSRPIPPAAPPSQQPGPSSSSASMAATSGHDVMVKPEKFEKYTEEVTIEDDPPLADDSYQDYGEEGVEGELEGYEDASGYGDDGSSNAFPTDSKDHLQDYLSKMDGNERKKRLDRLLGKDDNGRWTCSLCHSTFSRKVTAIDHIEEQHLKIPSYPCSYCHKLFVSCGQRRKHIFNVHRTENLLAKQLLGREEALEVYEPSVEID